jgi:hypothetical protein
MGVKTSTSGKISKYIEDFYLGDGNMQYFVKPLEYQDINEKETTLDATFRRIEKQTDSVTVNFNILLKTDHKVQNVTITNINNNYSASTVETFFIKKEDDLINHRLSIKVPYNFYYDNLLSNSHKIFVKSSSDSNTIEPSKKTQKITPILKQKISNLL